MKPRYVGSPKTSAEYVGVPIFGQSCDITPHPTSARLTTFAKPSVSFPHKGERGRYRLCRLRYRCEPIESRLDRPQPFLRISRQLRASGTSRHTKASKSDDVHRDHAIDHHHGDAD